jgi:MerR family transcriptional regulator, light-induced transcriptional regulator
MDRENERAVLRIGELSRRVGVSDHVLRAWESRYGLLKPVRSAGGFRLYSAADESRVRRMQTHLADGLSAAEAASATVAEESSAGFALRVVDEEARTGLVSSAEGLRQALDELDEPAAQAVLDRLLTDFTVETVLRDVVIPYLHDLGERWERGAISVAQEHFASHLIRGRLTSLARGWGNGRGPRVLLACPPGELHDLALVVFGIVLGRSGWRVEYLGVNTPVEDLTQVSDDLGPSLVVLAATTPERFAEVAPQLSLLAGRAPLALAGAGATKELAHNISARLLTGDPVTAAEHVAGP